MTGEEWTRLLQSEEAKRARHVDPVVEWEMIQQAITWAELQLPVPRNSRQRCLELQQQWRERLAAEAAGDTP